MKNKFFKSDKDRSLWIRLNAEHIRYSNNVMNGVETESLGSIDEQFSCMWISNNQLVYDEENREEPRLSLLELSSLSHEDILAITHERNRIILENIVKEYNISQDEL